MNNKTAREKMMAGEEYKETPDMFAGLVLGKTIMEDYNRMYSKDKKERIEFLKTLIPNFADTAEILPPVFIDFGEHITIGEHSFINHNCTILAENKVEIGNNVRIAPGCGIFTVGHSFDSEKRIEGYCYAKPVIIKDNVWIGGNASIGPGVTIGENSIIGMGSVVTKDIPANCIAAGNPCRVIRYLTKEDMDK